MYLFIAVIVWLNLTAYVIYKFGKRGTSLIFFGISLLTWTSSLIVALAICVMGIIGIIIAYHKKCLPQEHKPISAKFHPLKAVSVASMLDKRDALSLGVKLGIPKGES